MNDFAQKYFEVQTELLSLFQLHQLLVIVLFKFFVIGEFDVVREEVLDGLLYHHVARLEVAAALGQRCQVVCGLE